MPAGRSEIHYAEDVADIDMDSEEVPPHLI